MNRFIRNDKFRKNIVYIKEFHAKSMLTWNIIWTDCLSPIYASSIPFFLRNRIWFLTLILVMIVIEMSCIFQIVLDILTSKKHDKNFILQWKDLNDLPFSLILKISSKSRIGDITIQTIPSIYIHQFPYLMHFFGIFRFLYHVLHNLRTMKLFEVVVVQSLISYPVESHLFTNLCHFLPKIIAKFI